MASAAPVWRAVLAALGAFIVLVAGTTLSGSVAGRGSTAAASAQTQCSAPAWNSGSFYLEGAVVSHNGHEWRANHFVGPGTEPGNSGSPPWWVPWADLGTCGDDPPPTTTTLPSTTTTTTPGSTTTTTTTPGTTTTTTTVPPGETVEETYAAPGPWAVTTQTADISGAGNSTIFRPADLGEGGYAHPIVTWGNGALTATSDYSGILNHLASWGYVVVAPNTGQITPAQMIAAAEWLVAQNGSSSSAFFGQLDPDRVAAVGHSRGSSGAILAQTRSNGLIRTSVPIDTPDRVWWDSASDYEEISQLDSVFFVAGTNDFITSQADHQWFFDRAGGAAAVAAGNGHDHFEIQGPGTAKAGYITAWLRYELDDDQFARGAVVGSPPEINTNPSWAWQQQKDLR